MHYLKIAAVGLVCAFSDVVVASKYKRISKSPSASCTRRELSAISLQDGTYQGQNGHVRDLHHLSSKPHLILLHFPSSHANFKVEQVRTMFHVMPISTVVEVSKVCSFVDNLIVIDCPELRYLVGLSGYADAVTVTVTATLDPCICTASVPIHVTPAHYQTAAVPITSVTQAHLVKLPIGTGIPAGVHGSPVLEPFLPLHAPIQPPPIATAAASAFFSGKPQLAGTNATVTMSNLASAKSDLSKSSTKSFTAGASKHSSMTAFLLATFFAMSAKVLFL